jgi:uncharacterized iron-regulated membrane protein
MQPSNVDRELVDKIKSEIREALTTPLTEEELAVARAQNRQDLERQTREHEELQKRKPGAVRSMIFSSRAPSVAKASWISRATRRTFVPPRVVSGQVF